MNWLNSNRMRFMVVGVVAIIVIGGGGSVNADFVVGEPTFIEEAINPPGTGNTQGHSLLHDGLKLYHIANHGGTGRIWVSERESTDAPWGEPVYQLDTWALYLAISPDDLELYFSPSKRSTRPSTDEDWGPPTVFDELGDAWGLDFSPDGLTVYFDSDRSGGYGGWDIWMATRETVGSPWNEAVNLGPNVNGPEDQENASISNDGLALFFNHWKGSNYMCVRASTAADWGPAIDLDFDDTHPVLYGQRCDYYKPEISPDGSTLYLESHRSNSLGNQESFWQAFITPIVDLNNDGIVDAEDMCIIVDNWGTGEKLCDIGPMPWGDGVVDVEDLKILAEHLFEDYRLLVAHWPLDETEGIYAADSVSGNNDFVMGEPIWQPNGGKVDGALELDGLDDCIITIASLNPSDGPFSVFAWIKGGMPGQIVLSQQGGANWLCADASEGNLMTEFMGTGQDATAMLSQTVITDGDWHRIGFAWNGSHRTLYVDDVVVAEDMQNDLESSNNSLYIGTGKGMEPGTFWSGLIDDVRIYTVNP